jgi:hypothetical protein
MFLLIYSRKNDCCIGFFLLGFKVFEKRKKIYNNRGKSSGQEFHKCSLDTMFSIERKA